jgi:hypothetical protein
MDVALLTNRAALSSVEEGMRSQRLQGDYGPPARALLGLSAGSNLI